MNELPRLQWTPLRLRRLGQGFDDRFLLEHLEQLDQRPDVCFVGTPVAGILAVAVAVEEEFELLDGCVPMGAADFARARANADALGGVGSPFFSLFAAGVEGGAAAAQQFAQVFVVGVRFGLVGSRGGFDGGRFSKDDRAAPFTRGQYAGLLLAHYVNPQKKSHLLKKDRVYPHRCPTPCWIVKAK